MATSSRIVHHVTKLKSSDWFLEHDNEFTLLKWPPQSPDLNPIEHLWDVVGGKICIMDVQPTNLLQLHDAIMSIWTKISEECFQHLVKSMPRRIKAVLKTKGVQQGTSKVYLKKWPVNVYCSIYFFNNGDMILKIYIYFKMHYQCFPYTDFFEALTVLLH